MSIPWAAVPLIVVGYFCIAGFLASRLGKFMSNPYDERRREIQRRRDESGGE